MSYKVITETASNGSTVTYKVYNRNKWIAFLLAITLGALGVHFFYARHYVEGFLMWGITFASLFMVSLDSWWSYTSAVVSMVAATVFACSSKEWFNEYVNAR